MADGNANSQLQMVVVVNADPIPPIIHRQTPVNESPPWTEAIGLESGNPSPRVPADPEDSGTRANIKKYMHAIMTFGSGGALAFLQVDTRNLSQKIFYYASVTFLGMSALSAAVTRLMIHKPAHHTMKYLSFSFMFPTCLLVLGFLFVLVFVLIKG